MKLRNIIIIVLSVIVLAFSALFLISLNRLTDLKAEVASLSDQVQEIADEASSLASQSAADNSQTTAQADTDTASNQTAQADDASRETEDSDKKTAEIAPPSGSSQLEQEEAAPITDDLSNLQSQLEQIIGTFSDGTWSVSVTNLITGATCQINNGQMQAASLIKLYIMGAVYENYSEITSANDSNTVDSLLRSMITVSDNEAANQLVSMLGGGIPVQVWQWSTLTVRNTDSARPTWAASSWHLTKVMIIIPPQPTVPSSYRPFIREIQASPIQIPCTPC